MRYESLIFDIDGTLWDSRALVAEGYNIQLEKEGLSHLAVNAELFRPLFGKVMTEIADTIFPSIPAPERYALMERCMDTENKYLQANPCRIGYPGVRETMEKLAKNHNQMITSMAELIESRDVDTGMHVKRTCAYVRILAEAASEAGYCSDILTKDYIERYGKNYDFGHYPE